MTTQIQAIIKKVLALVRSHGLTVQDIVKAISQDKAKTEVKEGSK